MENSQGNTEQADNLLNNQDISVGRVPIGEFLYISVQNEGESGSVECTILVDGRAISTATSTGAYVIDDMQRLSPPNRNGLRTSHRWQIGPEVQKR